MSSKLGLRADAPIVVQPHWKSICRQRYNKIMINCSDIHWQLQLYIHTMFCETELTNTKDFATRDVPELSCFQTFPKWLMLTLQSPTKLVFFSEKSLCSGQIDVFSGWKQTSFHDQTRIRSIYSLLPSLIQRNCFQCFNKFANNSVKCYFSTL